jgi:flagellar hook-associated protein 2
MGMQTLGLGSDNRLSMDTIDKLKEVDYNATVTPIENSIQEISDKKTTLDELKTLLNEFNSSVSSLNDENLFLERTGYVSGEGIGVSIDKGVSPQSLSIQVNQLAEENIIQSDAFSSKTSTIADSDGTITIEINGQSKDFDVTSSTTLEDLQQDINDSDLDITAKILNTGTNEYRLILTSNKTGEDNQISITESDDLNTNLSNEDNVVQEAKDSKFLYNGVEISRSTNSVDDLIVGVNLEFTQVTDNPITIDIKEDVNLITSKVQEFVDKYNEVIAKLDEVTDYDETTNTAGIFQGNSEIRNITRTINDALLNVDSNGRSITDFGFDLSKEGILSFDTQDFQDKFNEDSSVVQDFFLGTNTEYRGVSSHQDGLFYDFDTNLDRIVGSNSLIENLNTSLQTQEDRFNEEHEKAITLLDNRYDRMKSDFARQDAIIAQIQSQMDALQMQIDMSTAKN